jgi:hypothetical protein
LEKTSKRLKQRLKGYLMARTPITPLSHSVPIVDPRTGTPSPQFLLLWQQLFGNESQTATNTEDAISLAEGASDDAIDAMAAAELAATSAAFDYLGFAASDETTAITVGTSKITLRMPYAFSLSSIRASVTTAPTGSTIIIDVNKAGVSILSTKLTIDIGEKTSVTAAVPPAISTTTFANDDEITIDFDQVGSTIAGSGVKIYLIGSRL